MRLESESVSRSHALLVRSPGGTLVRDLASPAGTFVNGRRVREADLNDGDELRVGGVRVGLKLRRSTAPPTPRAAPSLLIPADDDLAPGRIESRTFLVGRGGDCDLTLQRPDVSLAHAVLYELGQAHWVRDLGTRTGTRVNGEQVSQRRLQFGPARVPTSVMWKSA